MLYCSSCRAESPPTASFCGQCGQALAVAPAAGAAQSSTSTPSPGDAERRQLTVMFCDVVGSTALSEELDPEELRSLVGLYQQAAAKAIAPFEGEIAQHYGDGLLIYFGYPVAHEDEGVRAVNAGLSILRAMSTLSRPLSVRIGIHTGNVVIGEVGAGLRREQLAIGQAPNLAAHLQSIAAPNTVVLSEATYRLAEGFFNFEPLGPKTLKGTSKPILVYRALEESGVHGRFEITVQRGLSSLVGRRAELDLLGEKMHLSVGGAGQAVLVTGDAGLGKSRIVHAFREELRTELSTWWVYRCTPYTQNTSLYPIVEMIHHQLNLEPTDSRDEKIAKLEARCDAFGLPRAENVPLIATLIALPLDGRYAPLKLSPDLLKERVLEFLVNFVLARTEELPVVFFMEDLHWVDPSTMEFVERLLDRSASARLLTLFTARSGFKSPWDERANVETVALRRLGVDEIEMLIGELTGGRRLSAELRDHLLEKTDGVPLYVEEMTKSLIDSELVTLRDDQYVMAEGSSRVAIPTTLRDSLTARLDRLGSAKAIAQLGGAVGREFSLDLLTAVCSQDETTLHRDLDRLVEAELLDRRTDGSQTIYAFKHALVQDAAHDSLLRSQRQVTHEHIARVLEEKFESLAGTQPELLAYHYEEAQNFDEAAGCCLRAGQQALQRSAYRESVSHCRKGLALLRDLERTPARLECELGLRSVLGVGLIVTRGYQADEVAENSARAQEACQELGATPLLIPSLYGQWVFHLLRGHRDESAEVAQQIRSTVQDDPAHRLISFSTLGTTSFYAGRFQEARVHFESANAIYQPELHAELAQSFGDDSGLLPSFYHWWVLWILGEPAAALAHKDNGMRAVEELGSPYVLATGLLFEMILWRELRDTERTREVGKRLLDLSREQRYVFFESLAKIGHSWALSHAGRVDESVHGMQEGLATHSAIGTCLPRSYWLGYLIDVLLAARRTDEGLQIADEALELTKTQLDVFYDADILRLRGDLLVQAARPEEAEAVYLASLETARRTGARAFELRAATGLARLYRGSGRDTEGRAILAPVLAACPADLRTPDLEDAAALLT